MKPEISAVLSFTGVAKGVGTESAAVVAVTQTSSAASKKDKRATRGYSATEYVNNYYRTAKV